MSQHDGSRVFYFTRMLAEYRIPILERLNERLDGRLIVFSGNPPDGTSTLLAKSVGDFEHHPLPNYWFRHETLHAQPFGSAFRKYGPPAVVIAEESPRSISLPFLMHKAHRGRAGFVLWGMFRAMSSMWSSYHPFQRYRICLAKRADACVCYTNGVRELLMPYIDRDKLFVATNTLDTDRLFALRRSLEKRGKDLIRESLGIPREAAVILFSGQLITDKGTTELLEVYRKLSSKRPTTLLVVGDGPEAAFMQQRVADARLRDVRFLGKVSDIEKSAPFFFAADAMVIPGYVGLAVNHAFSMGVPVITKQYSTTATSHAPEVEYISHEYNGMLSGPDSESLVGSVTQVLDNQEFFARNAIETAETELTIDRMIDGLTAAVEVAQNSSRRV